MTRDQWFLRIKSWVPDWMFEQSNYVVPVLESFAQMMSQHEAERDALLSETFIQEADFPWLDQHGHERSIDRGLNTDDPTYRILIRYGALKSKCQKAEIKALVDQLLLQGQCKVEEDVLDSVYLNRGCYLSRDQTLINPVRWGFSVVVPAQHHAPYAFYSRTNFLSRYDFIGTDQNNDTIYQNLIAVISSAKAFGVAFRIIVSSNQTVF